MRTPNLSEPDSLPNSRCRTWNLILVTHCLGMSQWTTGPLKKVDCLNQVILLNRFMFLWGNKMFMIHFSAAFVKIMLALPFMVLNAYWYCDTVKSVFTSDGIDKASALLVCNLITGPHLESFNSGSSGWTGGNKKIYGGHLWQPYFYDLFLHGGGGFCFGLSVATRGMSTMGVVHYVAL